MADDRGPYWFRVLTDDSFLTCVGFCAFFAAAAVVLCVTAYYTNARWTEESKHQNEAVQAVLATNRPHAEQFEMTALIKGNDPVKARR